MRKLKAWIGVGAIVGVAGVVGIVTALDDVSPWLRTDAPTIQNMTDLPDNVSPSYSNLDCSTITAQYISSSSMHSECVFQTPLGLASSKGVTFNGSSYSIPVEPPSQYNGLFPVPNQEMFYTLTGGPAVGSYLYFYRSIRDKMKPAPDFINGVSKFILTSGPDFMLRDETGAAIPVNYSSIAFSPNGAWMVFDSPNRGFVRINLTTQSVLPFAKSMNGPNDYGTYIAQMSITNDGNFVAVKPREWPQFSVYDLKTCTAAPLPVDPAAPARCKSRDYCAGQ